MTNTGIGGIKDISKLFFLRFILQLLHLKAVRPHYGRVDSRAFIGCSQLLVMKILVKKYSVLITSADLL